MNLSFWGDNIVRVSLNGNPVDGVYTFNQPPSSPLAGTASTVTASAPFNRGMNSLTVVVHDNGGITGFDMVGTVIAN